MDPGGAGLNWKERGLTPRWELFRNWRGDREATSPIRPARLAPDCHTPAAPLLLHSHYLPQVSCPSQAAASLSPLPAESGSQVG